MKNLEKYVPILKENNFGLNTKALVNYLKGKSIMIAEFRDVIVSFNLVSEADAEVWAVMITNYNLNGSTLNLGRRRIFHRAYSLLNTHYTFEERKEGFSYYLTTVAPKTFNRWAKVLKELKEAQTYFAEEERKCAELALTYQQKLIKDLTLAEIEILLGFKVRIIS